MNAEQLVRRFRDLAEGHTNPMVRGAGAGIGVIRAFEGSSNDELVAYFDDLTRLWLEVKAEAQIV